MSVARRPYRMGARADSVRETATRIAEAALELFWEHPTDQLSLEEVGRRAGVSKQTVLRHYESKAGLLAAVARHGFARVREERDHVAPGDLAGAVEAIVAHYERVGRGVLRMLAEEDRTPAVREITAIGRAYHEEWCRTVFAPALAGVPAGPHRRRLLAQLTSVTDVLTWKLLRLDSGLTPRETETALIELLHPLTEGRP